MSTETTPYPAAIVAAITKVMGEDLYIQKKGKNQFHGYRFATVGDLLERLQPLMAEAGLVIFQHELDRDFIDGGNVLAIRYQFTLAHVSGAVWPDRPVHTGMTNCRNTKGGFDDKVANKSHTAARKYFLMGLFQVPTGDDYKERTHDGDADEGGDAPPVNRTPRAEPAGQQGNQQQAANGKGNGTDRAESREAREKREKADMQALYNELCAAIEATMDHGALDELVKERAGSFVAIKEFSATSGDKLDKRVTARHDAISRGPGADRPKGGDAPGSDLADPGNEP